MKQARDYRKYNVRLTSADWQRGSGRVIFALVRLTHGINSYSLQNYWGGLPHDPKHTVEPRYHDY